MKDIEINITGKKLPRQPKWSAVTITIPPEAETSYEQVMGIAGDKISLVDMGIDTIKPKNSITG